MRVRVPQNLKAASTTNFEAAGSVIADPTEVGLRGSDSGISMTSQQEQEIRDLLNVPWDMPKLRKKTEQGRNKSELLYSNNYYQFKLSISRDTGYVQMPKTS